MRRRACLLFLILLTATTALSACGGDDDEANARDALDALEDGSISPEEAEDLADMGDDFAGGDSAGSGSCSVNVSGDVEASWEAEKGLGSVGSDYYFSEEELEQTAELLGGEVEEGTFYAYGLILNCEGEDGYSFSILTTTAATPDNFPFEPGTYDIEPGLMGTSDQDGLLGSVLSLGNGTDAPLLQATSGTLDITRFEESGFEATATLELEEFFGTESRTGTLEATFSYECGDGGCQ
jgi:hypothetical protein